MQTISIFKKSYFHLSYFIIKNEILLKKKKDIEKTAT